MNTFRQAARIAAGIITVVSVLLAAATLAKAQSTAPNSAPGATPDPAAFERIITSQITALRADDGIKAFAHASPDIRRQFGTPDNFMAMVKQGYPQVYRPQSYKFGKITTEMSGRPTQRVHITDANGQSWTALYAFEQQPDKTWRIAGVVIVRAADLSA
jgi:hypothetical protein